MQPDHLHFCILLFVLLQSTEFNVLYQFPNLLNVGKDLLEPYIIDQTNFVSSGIEFTAKIHVINNMLDLILILVLIKLQILL